MRIWATVQAVIIVVAFGLGMFFMHQTTNCGIADITTVDDFMKMDPIVETCFNAGNDLSENKEHLFSFLEKDFMGFHSDRQILVVSPTKSMRQYYGGFTQLVTVEQVVEGDADLVGQKVDFYVIGGLVITGDSVSTRTYFSKNIMLPENSYIVFCEKTEISDYRDIPLYRVPAGGLTYFNLNSDYSFVKSDGANQPYSLFKESEFCFVDQKTLDILLKFKKEIINKFYVQQ